MWDDVTVSRSDLESTPWCRVKYHADSRSKFIKSTDSNIIIRYLANLDLVTLVLDPWSVPVGTSAPCESNVSHRSGLGRARA